jgi:hypothetical protein
VLSHIGELMAWIERRGSLLPLGEKESTVGPKRAKSQ